ncbi:MAG: Zn-ribbon domain-containing OB-fold protein [Myxococcota bacterium]
MDAKATITLPVPSPITREYWDAARAGRLVLPRCRACGRYFFRPEVVCKHCRSRDWHYVESPGRGTLYSYSVIHRAPTPAYKTPFVLAIVELEEGITMFSNLVGCAPADAKIGMALEVAFEAVSDDITLPVFRPAAEV